MSGSGLNLAELNEAIAAAVPNREALIFRDRRYTYAQLTERSRRLANFLLDHGIKLRRERADLANWESGQDHVALYMYNGNEYPESILACLKARAVPVNVNYRYVAAELRYLLLDANTKAIIYHARFAPLLAEILADLPALKLLIQVSDDSGEALLPGAHEYEAALAMSSAERPNLSWSPDDIYMIYTGGTTGMPKGVLWRQGDFLTAMLSARRSDGSPIDAIDKFVQRALRSDVERSLPAPPYMHGTGQLVSFIAWNAGNTVVIQNTVARLDPVELLRTAVREKVTTIALVGDAFARPIVAEMKRGSYDLSQLKFIVSAGAVFSASLKDELIDLVPGVTIIDAFGSTETGPQVHNISSAKTGKNAAKFRMSGNSIVLSEDYSQILQPGHQGFGWFAVSKNVPLGYLGDEEKTKKAFPVINGVRYSVPGDRVKLLPDGAMEFLGRDSVTINSGGEKIFAEEVEQAIKHHHDVEDVVVSARPSERWGSEVVAIVQLRQGALPDEAAILSICAKHIAKYKFPKATLFVEKVRRGDNGKTDYGWAKSLAEASL